MASRSAESSASLGGVRWLTGGLKYTKDLSGFQEGAETTGGHAMPEVPSAHFGFGEGVMKYLIYHDPDWDYTDYNFRYVSRRREAGGSNAECNQS